MQRTMFPADVISLCSSDGEIRPLRVRSVDGSSEMLRGNICEIIRTVDGGHYGAETKSFLCRVQTQDRLLVMELKFVYRTHNWLVTSFAG